MSNQYLGKEAHVLVNRYAELKDQELYIKEHLSQVKDALFKYALEQEIEIIKGHT